MRQRVLIGLNLFTLTLLFSLCVYESECGSVGDEKAMAPDISSAVNPEPFLPLLAPSPLTPFTNDSIPALSVCCPQLEATMTTLIGHSSKYSRMLSLNITHAKHCLSDVEMILESQRANKTIQKICSIQPENLTEASCPVTQVDAFESIVDSSKLLSACQKVDPVNECCQEVCQNAILDTARKLAEIGIATNLQGVHAMPEQSTTVDDCENIVLRWLGSNLDPSSANKVLSGLSNCKVYKVCPLVFPNMTHFVKECANTITSRVACYKAMGSYVSQLQEQSFITNLQALNWRLQLDHKSMVAFCQACLQMQHLTKLRESASFAILMYCSSMALFNL